MGAGTMVVGVTTDVEVSVTITTEPPEVDAEVYTVTDVDGGRVDTTELGGNEEEEEVVEEVVEEVLGGEIGGLMAESAHVVVNEVAVGIVVVNGTVRVTGTVLVIVASEIKGQTIEPKDDLYDVNNTHQV